MKESGHLLYEKRGSNMPVIQIAMEMPEDICAGLAAGTLKRFGSVVRDPAGHIVEHLDEVKFPNKEPMAGDLEIVNTLKNTKKYVLIGLGLVAAVTAGGLIIHAVRSKSKKNDFEDEISAIVDGFNISMRDYLNAVQEGNLDMDTLTRIIVEVDKIKENLDNENIWIDFSTDQLKELLNLIYEYTIRLTEANLIDFGNIEKPEMTDAKAIINLQQYLAAQKKIFEVAS